jgi:hypothetical protein
VKRYSLVGVAIAFLSGVWVGMLLIALLSSVTP